MRCILIFFALITLTACGTTELYTKDKKADIYVDQRFVGKGSALIQRTGPPKRIKVTAKYQNKELGAITVKRDIKVITVIAGLYTYGIAFLFTWKYPRQVMIPTGASSPINSFESNSQSVWELPPGEYKK